MQEKLKPCPFKKGQTVWLAATTGVRRGVFNDGSHKNFEIYTYIVSGRHALVDIVFKTKKEAVSAWNKRSEG